MQEVSEQRASAFAHYVLSMKDVIKELSAAVRTGGPAIFVVGHSAWKENQIPTSDLFVEIAGDAFHLTEKLWYPVKNRYMSYDRRNGIGINQEHVLVFTRTRE